MAYYYYTREIVEYPDPIGRAYNIDNPQRVDLLDNQIYLANEVEVALIGRAFKLFCADSEVKFVFDDELSELEKTTLDTVVFNHKNNIL